MNRRSLVSGAAAGVVTLAAPKVTEGAPVMVKEVRQYTVKGMFEIEPRTLGMVGTTSETVIEPGAPTVAVRLAAADASMFGPMGQQDELTVIVPQDQASRWAFGKTFTMTITED